MAINGIATKASILDTYKDNKGFGGSTIPGYSDVKEVGGDKPKTTDFVKGTWPEKSEIKGGANAATGFTANIKKNGLKDSEFTIVDNSKNVTRAEFDALVLNNDYTYNTIKITGYNKNKRYKRPANP